LPHRLDVFGDGPHRAQVEATIARTGTADRVHLNGRVPMDNLPGLLAASDIGLVPSLPEPYLHYSLSTKLLEYAAMGIPIIASDLATFRAHFTDEAIRYVPGGDPAALAAAIRELAADPMAASRLGAEAHRQAADYAWSVQAERYLAIVERLVAAGGGG
jgi:glycosyltransferase involved in cell wall biosynthesis